MKQIDYYRISKYIMLLIVILLSIVLMYTVVRGAWYFIDSKRIFKELDEIKSIVDIDDDDVGPIDDVVDKDQDYFPTDIDNTGIYQEYLKVNPLNVDISKLKSKNSDTVAWLKVNGTSVSYPVVQAKDNKYYLNRSFSKSLNGAGWVFADYRNNFSQLDKNTVIYGHGRYDKTMFGTLKNLFTSDWQNNKNNHLINLSTEKENTLWQIFSVYHIPTTEDYIRIQFATDKEFLNLANSLINRSTFNFNTKIDKDDKILTLSTCLNSDDKIVVHAKLIKTVEK